jgi:hypothetical protein
VNGTSHENPEENVVEESEIVASPVAEDIDLAPRVTYVRPPKDEDLF